MANDTITLMLEGDVPLSAFAEAVKDFAKLVTALTNEEKADIEWTIEDLSPGSALATIRGESKQPEKVERVVRNYAQVGRAMQRNEPLHRPASIARPAYALGRLIGNKVRSIRLETPEEEAIISVRPTRRRVRRFLTTGPIGLETASDVIEFPAGAFGAVEGEVQTLTKRHGLRFTLYDALSDRAVSCYLQAGQEEQMRNVWGKHAIIQGWVTRDPTTGRPVAIRRISNISVVTEEGDYRKARGALPVVADELPEVRIRRLRDE